MSLSETVDTINAYLPTTQFDLLWTKRTDLFSSAFLKVDERPITIGSRLQLREFLGSNTVAGLEIISDTGRIIYATVRQSFILIGAPDAKFISITAQSQTTTLETAIDTIYQLDISTRIFGGKEITQDTFHVFGKHIPISQVMFEHLFTNHDTDHDMLLSEESGVYPGANLCFKEVADDGPTGRYIIATVIARSSPVPVPGRFGLYCKTSVFPSYRWITPL